MYIAHALISGTVVTAKTVLYEISDNSNQAVGMSIISVAWGLGVILGPTVGGMYYNLGISPDVKHIRLIFFLTTALASRVDIAITFHC